MYREALQKLSSENCYHKGNDEYATPIWIKEGIFKGWFDPCPLSKGLTRRDGLKEPWFGDKVFVNPPYSDPSPWVDRAIWESRENGKTVALLVKHDNSTKWWAKLHGAGGHFLPIMERLSFDGKSRAPFPSVLVILHSDGERLCLGEGKAR